MVTYAEALSGAVTGAFCTVVGSVNGLAGLVSDSLGDIPLVSPPVRGAQAALGALGQAFCGGVPDGSNVPSPPFQGGQCSGVGYSVSGRLRQFNASGSQIFNGIVGTTGVGPVQLTTRTRNDGGEILEWIFGDDSNFVVSSVPPDFTYTYTEISVARTDGQPDDCGNIDNNPVPYNPGDYTTNPDVTYDGPGGPVTVNPTVVFAPVLVNIMGNVVVPVRVEVTGELNLFGELNLTTGDFNLNLGNGGGGAGDGSDDEPSEERNDSIIAVRVLVTNIEPGYGRTEIFPVLPASDSLFVPRLATVRFFTENGTKAGRSWTEDVDVRMQNQIIACPVSWGAVDVKVEPSPGVDLQFTPIYARSVRSLLLELTSS